MFLHIDDKRAEIVIKDYATDVGLTFLVNESPETSPPKPYKDAELIRDCHRVHLPDFRDGVVKDIMFLQSKGYLHRNRMGEYSLTESGKALNYIIKDMAISDSDVLKTSGVDGHTFNLTID